MTVKQLQKNITVECFKKMTDNWPPNGATVIDYSTVGQRQNGTYPQFQL